MKKKQGQKTGWMCTAAYNGTCNRDCRHLLAHPHISECTIFCQRENIDVVCIEVDSPEIRDFPTKQGKKIFRCKTGCGAECCGNVPILKSVIKGNRKKIQRKYEPVELGEGMIYPLTTDKKCIFLNKGLECEIYFVRPFVCKMYGQTEELQCPHIGIDGKERTPAEVLATREKIAKTTDERFEAFHQKYHKKLGGCESVFVPEKRRNIVS